MQRFCHRCFCGVVLAMAMLWSAVLFGSPAAAPLLPNADFEQGDTTPSDWALSDGLGRWVDRHILEVTGDSKGQNCWQHAATFTPGGLYRFQMRARSLDACSAISGPSFANRDQPLSDRWGWYDNVFRAPDHITNDVVRLGQWQVGGSVQFDAVRLAPVEPVYKPVGSLELGEGESIAAGRYTFLGTFGQTDGNFHRPLVGNTARFNTNRWCFDGGGEVTYRFGLPGVPFRSASIQFGIGYYLRGGCTAEISRDRANWQTLATRNSSGQAVADVPADLFPAEMLYLRLRCSEANSVFQVEQIGFSAELAGTPKEGRGQTTFAEVVDRNCGLSIAGLTLDDSNGCNRPIIRAVVKNANADVQASLFIQVAPRRLSGESEKDQSAFTQIGDSNGIAKDQARAFEAAIPIEHCGTCDIRLSFRTPAGEAVAVTVPWTVPEYYRSDYGSRIEGVEGDTDVWWCEATWKVAPQRETPKVASPSATLSAACNDREAVQIVVRPKSDLRQLTAVAGSLQGPGGAVIPAEAIQVLRAYYHFVQEPTDKVGVRDWWPDALPPLDQPLDVPAGKNQPLWVLIHVPKDAKAGDYAGALTLKAEGWSTVVPIALHVWNFALPERNHIETAFGMNSQFINTYHQLNTDAQKRQVWDMYMQSLAEHRISPYHPAPYDPIQVKMLPDADPPRAELDFSAFDAGIGQAIDQYHITNFMLPIQGMGGGTFEGRDEPKIDRFGEDTPQYQAMFASQLKQMESHLREKGWLDMAYTYWFDEPEPKDYAYVQAGMDRIKKSAPGIQTMITKHELQGDWSGKIDIWCPISCSYQHAVAEKRRPQGERYWWYVCCVPKEPFCTLFIDHPATDLRAWLWQTWQRKIVGILVWESAYWCARGDVSQNPYDDPMGYVSGSRPGERKYWGNGDGRFVYPPLSAATPGASGNEPVIAPPVSSIRWEMLREGIEDYEFLWLLRDLIGKRRGALSEEQLKTYEALLQVPEEISSDMITYATDPTPIYTRRAAIAEAIERLKETK